MKSLLFLCLLSINNFVLCFAQYVVTDQYGIGRMFEGIGAISGGGVNVDANPNFGASLQILKVEIGGDDESSGGTEASHMHEEWDENYNRGYEWWLMKEAKKRNPYIKLWGLSWSWPHWLGDAKQEPYNDLNKTAMYTANWIKGAKEYHNLTIDYIGIWNERPCNLEYIVTLRKVLNDNDVTKNVQIVACDNFGDFPIIARNRTVLKSIYAYGAHYPGTEMTPFAVGSNISLWASEDYSTYNDDVGAGCWARLLNQNYVNGYMTSTTAWNLIASYYLGLAYQEDSLMTAVEPWSGYYEVKNPIWITAHTTQFVDIGWFYLSHGFGVGHLEEGGSFVSLMSPDAKQLTLIIETISHDHSICIRPDLPPYNVSQQQTATFKFGGKFKKLQTLWLWRTELKFDGTPSTAFQPYGLIAVEQSSITLNLEVDNIYTLTTVNTGNHGDCGDQSVSSPFPLPYEDDFQSYQESQEPYLFTPQVGTWEIVKDEQGNQFCRQMVLSQPVPWCGSNIYPFAIIGDINWTEINITATLLMPSINGTDSVFVAGLIQMPGCSLNQTSGIFFWLNKQSSTFQITLDIGSKFIVDHGSVGFTVQYDTWYTLSLAVKNNTVFANVDGAQKASVNITQGQIKNGFAGVGSVSYGHSDIKYLLLNVPNV